jgi:hypothetical protein
VRADLILWKGIYSLVEPANRRRLGSPSLTGTGIRGGKGSCGFEPAMKSIACSFLLDRRMYD